MSSSAAPSSLSRILWGSLIGAAIGLVLLALGVAILWNAADQRLAETQAAAPSEAAAPSPQPTRKAVEASPVPYPVVGPGAPRPAAPIEPEPRASAATSIWRSIFDDAAETAESAMPAAATPRADPPAAAPRPAVRPTPPRRPPEAQRQDESLFF